jgi:hypothetical protein
VELTSYVSDSRVTSIVCRHTASVSSLAHLYLTHVPSILPTSQRVRSGNTALILHLRAEQWCMDPGLEMALTQNCPEEITSGVHRGRPPHQCCISDWSLRGAGLCSLARASRPMFSPISVMSQLHRSLDTSRPGPGSCHL